MSRSSPASAEGNENLGRGKHEKSWQLIEAAHAILAEIQPATVRAVCYRLFVGGVIPDMSKPSTQRVSTQLTWAREYGHIPWNQAPFCRRAPRHGNRRQGH